MFENHTKKLLFAFVTIAFSFGIAGCSDNGLEVNDRNVISFAPSISNMVDNETKANIIGSGDNFFPNQSTEFMVASYGIGNLVEGNIIPAYTKVKYFSAETTWHPVDGSGNKLEYCWVIGTTQRFFAYANLPSAGASVSNSNDAKQTLTYDASAATDPKDILLGFAESTATTSTTAAISFFHPLTALKFTTTPELLSYQVISKITLSGLAKSGSVEMNSLGDFGDWNYGPFNYSIERTSVGDWYLLIPQGLVDHNVTVSVDFESGLSSSATIKTGVWVEGYKNEYELKYSDYKEMNGLTITLKDWAPVINKGVTDTTYFSIDFNK